MTDVRALEHHTLKVPYEILNKKFRSAQKVLDREAAHVQGSVTDVEKWLKESDGRLSSLPQLLGNLEDHLSTMRDKAQESINEEVSIADNCLKRLDHLKDGCCSNRTQWNKTRLNRLMVEHFLRSGYYDTAIALARAADIEEFTNINLFLVAKEVEEALAEKDVTKCLAWCHDNKSKLRKIKSSLEFNVRLQEFIEYIKAGQKMEAVKHARKFLSTADTDQLIAVQRACALLAFPSNTPLQPYREAFKEERWRELVEQFRAENYRLYQLSNQSVFTAALQAGLSALKTPRCYRPTTADRNEACPVCQVPLNNLAAPLPFAHCSQSRLICAMSGKPLNEHNHPMMLPNGYVYGEQALTQMALENDGNIVCPRTKEIFFFRDASKVYVM